MLYLVDKLVDSYVSLFSDDPVRPEIPWEFRCQPPNSFAFILFDSQCQRPRAVLCCVLKSFVPASMDELLSVDCGIKDKAIFYTIWSYDRGAGGEIIKAAPKWILVHRVEVVEFYTYSPQSESVRKFHLGQGASIYRQNQDSINYQYSNF